MHPSLRKAAPFLALASALFMAGSCRQPEPPSEALSTTIDGEYIVVYKTDPLAGARAGRTYRDMQSSVRQFTNRFLTQRNVTASSLLHVYSHALNGFAVRLTAGQVEALRNDPSVAYVAPNQRDIPEAVEGDITLPGAKVGAGQEVPWGIQYVGGFVDCSQRSNVVYVLDTGIDLDHPDLNVDTTRGFNVFTSGRDALTFNDLNGHGTVVAGIIGAKNNGLGIVGVAAGVKLVPVKTKGSDNESTVANTIAGLDFVAANARPGDVMNLSLGFPANQAADDAVIRTLSRGDIYAAAAAGNFVNGNRDANKISPARVNTTNFYTISAHDKNGVFCASFSCMGNPPIDFAAPGNQIKSTYYNGGYINVYGGTTLCTAHASGILLVTGGRIYSKSVVKNDPDKKPDPIASRLP